MTCVATLHYITKCLFHCDFSSWVVLQTCRDTHAITFLHLNIRRWHAAGSPQPNVTLRSLMGDVCVFFCQMFLTLWIDVYLQVAKKKNWWWFQMWVDSSGLVTQSKDTRKMLHLFNRCHINFKTLETDIQEGSFFPFLRLQINVACVLSLFYKSTHCKWNT